MTNITVSTIIRIHDVSKINHLVEAVRSLHSQRSVSVKPIIVMQRFSIEEQEQVIDAVSSEWFFKEHGQPSYLNLNDGLKNDARSKLINIGIKEHLNSGNRYLGFLDYDDILFSHAYEVLVSGITVTGAAISFATVEISHSMVMDGYDFIYDLTMPFVGGNKFDLIKDNFCPIHSYLIDTNSVDSNDLFFREDMSRVEDYEFLLRVAGKNPCDFSGLGKKIGLYSMRNDESNTTPTQGIEDSRKKDWDENVAKLNKYRSQVEIKFFASDF